MTEAPGNSESLAEWLLWLEQLDPSRIEFGLERIQRVYQRLPQLSPTTRVVTVAGTNGKGSCVTALQSAAIALNKDVVAFISPHLLQYNERIQIQGRSISDEELVSAFQQISWAQQDDFLSYFEYSALAVLVVASKRQPDLLILEVGMGGRLDAVNIIDADIVVLTAIGLDHTKWLGEDLDSIAKEKCGVIRDKIPVVLAAPDMPDIVYQIAKDRSVELYEWATAFEVSHRGERSNRIRIGDQNLDIGEQRLHPQSIGGAAMAVELLWPGNLPNIIRALEKVDMPGRFQRCQIGSREVIFDVAHNAMSFSNLSQRLQREGFKKADLIFAMMSDKDCQAAIAILAPIAESWKLIRLTTKRALSPEDLRTKLGNSGVKNIEILDLEKLSPSDQLFVAKKEQNPLLVTGSFYTVSAILEQLDNRNVEGKKCTE